MMNIQLGNADLVAIVALALGCALLMALRFKPKSWLGVVCEAFVANLAAIATIVVFEVWLS